MSVYSRIGVLLCSVLLLPSAWASNYVVSSLDDSGANTLRAAIIQANASAEDDSITFSIDGSIILTSELPSISAAGGRLTIMGNGSTNTVLNGNGSVRVLSVAAAADLTLKQLKITAGRALAESGGGVSNNGGSLTLSEVWFSGNIGQRGGAVLSDSGTLTVERSSFISNAADNDGGGIYSVDSAVIINDATFIANTARYDGGGILVTRGTLSINRSTFNLNEADHGGSILNVYGQLTVSDTLFDSNGARTNGGGIFNNGHLSVTHSQFSNNWARSQGGGIFNYSEYLWLTNAAFNANRSQTKGGALYIANGELVVTHATLSANSAADSSGGGVYLASGSLILNNSIMAHNTGGDCSRNADGDLTANYSLIADGLSCINNPASAANLALNPQLNADLTLQALSPALDAGNDSLIPNGIITDLAGHARIYGARVDMGAYEYGSVPLLSLSPVTGDASEGGASADVTITRTGSHALAQVVNVGIALGANTSEADYQLSTAAGPLSPQSGVSRVTIPAGVSSLTLTVAAIDDARDESHETLTLALASSADYQLTSANTATITLLDNDTAGISVTPTHALLTTEAGGSAAFSVVLNSQPTAEVNIALHSRDVSEGVVSPTTLTFGVDNWNSAQTVTVQGVDDALFDGDVNYTIILSAAVSDDPNYSAMNSPSISVSNRDDEAAAGIPTLSEWALLGLSLLLLGLGVRYRQQ